MLGPYHEAGRAKPWRVVAVAADGTREETRFARKATAEAFAAAYKAELPDAQTVGGAVKEYRKAMTAAGNKAGSVATTCYRLAWLPAELPIADLTPRVMAQRYKERSGQVAAATHRAELAECKTFLRWCAERRYILRSPAKGIKPVGRVKRGKKQLRASEARKLSDHCLSRSDDLAVAALCCLWLGLRSGEVRQRVARDVDDTGSAVWLWVDEAKTEAGQRRVEVPEPLGALLLGLADRGGYLFPSESKAGYRGATWLRKGVARLCKAAGVPVVCPHGLRGTHATLAQEAGLSSAAVAATLGHENVRVTEQSYTAPGTAERAGQKRALKVLQGGAG